MKRSVLFVVATALLSLFVLPAASAQTFEERLQAVAPTALVRAAREQGDATRGAIVFYQPHVGCTRCHIAEKEDNRLGPDLTKLPKDVTDVQLLESVLWPSKVIREGYEPVTVLTKTGLVITGVLESQDESKVVVRDAAKDFKTVEFARADLITVGHGETSIMPGGQVNVLTSQQQFLDLLLYLIEIREGGPDRARDLEPPPSLYAARPLPEYESRIDHAGMIKDLDGAAAKRGQKIYERLCVNCHGTHSEPGSLPNSRRFATEPFKNGHDPYAQYQTLTRGFGMMVAQTWMVPKQKYDVIHYIREAYLKRDNPSQYSEADAAYLASLPTGDTRGPEPSNIVPWTQMDYGPNQMMTLEVGRDAKNFAYKGNAIRLDAGPGGISRGRYWMLFDYDTLRVAAAWSGDEFCDWNSIHFNGRHAIHPRVVGTVHLENPTGPGWGRPSDESFEDIRLVGRDNRIYGPLPRRWAQYRGMYYHGPNTIIEYTVGDTRLLEMPGVLTSTLEPVFTRTLDIGPRSRDLVLQVGHRSEPGVQLTRRADGAVLFGPPLVDEPAAQQIVKEGPSGRVRFKGATRVEAEGLELHRTDFTVTARIRTKKGGTILSCMNKTDEWHRDGMTWFVSGGRLTYDIGWVGAFRGGRRVADGKWHDVAVTWRQRDGALRFFVDGEPDDRTGRLEPERQLQKTVVRVGATAADFPKPSFFNGDIADVRVFGRILTDDEVATTARSKPAVPEGLLARWDPSESVNGVVTDRSGNERDGTVRTGKPRPVEQKAEGWLVAGTEGDGGAVKWLADGGDLRLRIPAGDQPLRFTLWFATAEKHSDVQPLVETIVIDDPGPNLTAKTKGGPSRWPDVLTAEATIGPDDDAFALDVLTMPAANPWFCRMRLTGFDFLPGGDQAIVCAWDGSVWLVKGLAKLPETRPDAEGERKVEISWRRIASGLFQPLGLKVVDGKVYVACRDQICVLHDLNGDEEVDWYECFNNDHQVTDHFHEFAMGLQVDDDGNFLYAKSARHALPALVPHHGTLLRVSKDGLRTEILANGFRAANGTCINPDGTYIVTDQEGHWTPKNRINYIKEGGFYGNMYGYHDVTDEADDAMEQPLCWITNSFDRSPAELLWVTSDRWAPLKGQLLNLSYGYGMVYVVPHEKIDGQAQGGMCELPIKRSRTGIMRGRFHPDDGQLYTCGMFAWAGSQQKPGGFYRLRYTGKPVHLPVDLKAYKKGITIKFSGDLDPESAGDAKNYRVKIWGLKRTKNYGSPHVNERALDVTRARVEADRRTVHLEIPDIETTWCMEIRYKIRSAEGKTIDSKIHNTIHVLPDR